MSGTMLTSGSWSFKLKFMALLMVSTATLCGGSRNILPQNHQHDLINVTSSNGPPPPPPPPPFDYYLLSIQWPKSVCYVKGLPCDKDYNITLPRKFTVHGLWPKINPSNDPPPNHVQFDAKKIQNYQDLNSNWMNAMFKFDQKKKVSRQAQQQKANEFFWTEEWLKHGDLTKKTQEDYFQLAMTAYRKFEPTTEVTQFVGQNFGQGLDRAQLILAIRHKLGVDASIRCNQDKNNNSQLLEIRIKLTADASTVLQATNPNGNCGLKVWIPA